MKKRQLKKYRKQMTQILEAISFPKDQGYFEELPLRKLEHLLMICLSKALKG